MMRETPMQFLMIGCGGISHAHLQAFESHPGKLRLVAASDPSEVARKAVAERMKPHGSVWTFADHEEALDSLAGEIDAALVVSPHFLHYPQARACVEVGIPVLVEKPICNNLDETRRLKALAGERAITVMAGQTKRYTPFARHARQWVKRSPENFGTLSTFAIESWQNILCWIATKPDKNADFWILDKKRAGGGVVVSLSCHAIDLVRYISGQDFVQASALGSFEAPFKNGAESACAANLKLAGGGFGTLNASYLAKRIPYSESFKMFGTQGSIVQHADEWGRYDGEIRVGSSDDDPAGWNDQFAGLDPLPENLAWKMDMDPFPFTNQLLEFRSALLENREPLTGIGDNMNTMAAIEAIYESMNNGGQTVKIADL